MENASRQEVSRQAGARSRQVRLWVASLVIAEQKRMPIDEVHRSLVSMLGTALRPSDVTGALQIQKLHEDTVQRGLDFANKFSGGLNLQDPAVVRMMTGLKPGAPADEALESERPAPAPEPARVEDDHALPTVVTAPVDEEEGLPPVESLFEDWPFDVAPVEDDEHDAQALAQQQALDAYIREIVRSAKVPTTPYCRPDLGVSFFPTGRFEVADTDWNFNGQVEGEMISDCGENQLVFRGGVPLKGSIDFKDWGLSQTQTASGALWVWGVKHVSGKNLRFWLNDGSDQLKLYYTMTNTGLRQVRKKPTAPGSKKFVRLDERKIQALRLETLPAE